MQTSKLFNALVMSGALIAAGCAAGGDSAPANKPEPTVKSGGSSTGPAPAVSKRRVFCAPDDTRFCSDGKAKAGFECCWATNC